MDALGVFLVEYGSRGLSEIDLMVPKWYEERIKVTASHLKKEAGSHRTQEQKLIEAREKATEKFLFRSKGLKKRLTKHLIYVMANDSILRELRKFAVIQVLRVAK